MFSTILNLNNANFDIIDLGGLSFENNNIDKFKTQFSRKKVFSYMSFRIQTIPQNSPKLPKKAQNDPKN